MSRLAGETIEKDPSSIEPQGFDWTDYLAELGVGIVITVSTWTVTGPDAVLTVGNDTIVAGALKTQAYLSAGTAGTRYMVTNRITANASPTVIDDRSFFVQVEER